MGGDSSRFLDALIGGWSVQAIGQLQSGRPISFHDRNSYSDGDLSSLKSEYSGGKNNPAFDISGFYFHDAAVQTGSTDPTKRRNDQRIRLLNNIRYFPSPRARASRARLEPLGHLAGQAGALLRSRARAVPRGFINPVNHPIFNNPNTDPTNANFGKVTKQANLPRDIQLAAKIVF